MNKRRGIAWITAASLAAVLAVGLAGCGTQPVEPRTEDIVVLYTNDVHCGIEEDLGYAGLAAYQKEMEAETPHVTLVDCGDAVQGDFIGIVSDGEYIVDIMNRLEYDFAVPGNHEFDYGMEQLSTLIDMADAAYLGCNVRYEGSQSNALADVKPYEIVEYDDTSVAFIGVITPNSLNSSTPRYFMENGEYVYSFYGGEGGAALHMQVQKTVDECRAKGADYVVVLSHLGDADAESPYSSVEMIRGTTGIDVVLDGHTHSVMKGRTEKNKDGEDVLLTSTGTRMDNVGKLTITAEGEIITELIADYAAKDAEFAAYLDTVKANYEEEMNRVVATSDIALSGFTEDGIRLVRNRETTIGNFCADAYRAASGADIAIVNGGGIRADLLAGDITYADILAVHPYGNTLCMVKATGQEILDSLEIASRETMAVTEEDGHAIGEEGSFHQVSGLKYTIDTSVKHSVALDAAGMCIGIGDTRRVKDVFVLNSDGEYEPLDPKKEYTVASHNYLIKECGGGIVMFADNELLIDEGMSDYQILVDYLTDGLNGELDEKYSAAEGRIIIK